MGVLPGLKGAGRRAGASMEKLYEAYEMIVFKALTQAAGPDINRYRK